MRPLLTKLCNALWYGGSRAWIVLWPISLLYRGLFVVHRAWQKPRALRSQDGVPVVVVGNISVGGTGKTPLIIWLAHQLLQLGFSVGIISRGYLGGMSASPHLVAPDASPAMFGDEPVLLARRTGCPVVVAANRVRARDLLMSSRPVDLVLSDDGLQHHRLPRCCEIVVVDGSRGFGNGACLPAGPLREPATRLDTVDAVVVNGPGWEFEGAIRATVEASGVERLCDGAQRPLETFAGEYVHAVAGIGNPHRFFNLLKAAGIRVRQHALSDHEWIEPRHLSFDDNAAIMLTEKDAVKCRDIASDNIWIVKVEMVFEPAERERLLSIVADRVEEFTR